MKRKGLFFTYVSIFILLSAMIAVSPVSADATITLSPSGGNDTAAIHAAITNIDDGGTIYFEAGTFHANISITNPGKSFSLVGAGAGETILDGDITGDGNGDGRILSLTGDKSDVITIEGISFINGSAAYGGAINCEDFTIIVNECVFNNNKGGSNGGAVRCARSNTKFNSCIFSYNSADGSYGGGGAIYIAGGQCQINIVSSLVTAPHVMVERYPAGIHHYHRPQYTVVPFLLTTHRMAGQ